MGYETFGVILSRAAAKMLGYPIYHPAYTRIVSWICQPTDLRRGRLWKLAGISDGRCLKPTAAFNSCALSSEKENHGQSINNRGLARVQAQGHSKGCPRRDHRHVR